MKLRRKEKRKIKKRRFILQSKYGNTCMYVYIYIYIYIYKKLAIGNNKIFC